MQLSFWSHLACQGRSCTITLKPPTRREITPRVLASDFFSWKENVLNKRKKEEKNVVVFSGGSIIVYFLTACLHIKMVVLWNDLISSIGGDLLIRTEGITGEFWQHDVPCHGSVVFLVFSLPPFPDFAPVFISVLSLHLFIWLLLSFLTFSLCCFCLFLCFFSYVSLVPGWIELFHILCYSLIYLCSFI